MLIWRSIVVHVFWWWWGEFDILLEKFPNIKYPKDLRTDMVVPVQLPPPPTSTCKTFVYNQVCFLLCETIFAKHKFSTVPHVTTIVLFTDHDDL